MKRVQMEDSITFTNPIVPGFAPDPSVVFVDGFYFLVTSSFHIFPGIPIYVSQDLQNWRLIGHGINRIDQLSLENASTIHLPLDTGHSMAGTGGLYAPTIRYNNGMFYIVCTNCIMRSDGMKTDNFVISSKDIWSGDWSNPIYFPLPGIDPDLYFDDDGRVYVQGSWQMDRLKQPRCTIKQYEIDLSTGKPLEEPREIWQGFAKYDTEGPHIYKKDGWYYLVVAEGGTFEHHQLSIARSRSVRGPYEPGPINPIMTADGKEEYIQNVGHGEIFQDIDGRWWAAVLGVRNEEGWPLGRESFLTPVSWPEEKWPTVSQPRLTFERSGARLPGTCGSDKRSSFVMGWLKSVAAYALRLFRSETAACVKDPRKLEYVYIRNVNFDNYLFDPNNVCTISLMPTINTLSTPTGTTTFLGMRQRALNCTATVTIDLNGSGISKSTLKAGLSLYKDHLRHASILFNSKDHSVYFTVTNTTQSLLRLSLISLKPGDKILNFRIEATRNRYKFSFQRDSEDEFVEAGSVLVTELFARDFTGPIFGIFAESHDSIQHWVTFRDFKIDV